MNLNIIFRIGFWRVITAALSFLTVMLCMKNLEVTQFANYSLAFTIYTAFCLLPNLGVNNYMVLEEAKKELIEKNNNIKIYFSVVVVVMIVLKVLNIISDIMFFAATAGIFSSVIDYNLSKLQAQKNFKVYALLMPLRTLVFFLVVLLTIFYIKEDQINNIYKISAISFLVVYLLFILRSFNRTTLALKDNLILYKGAASFLVFELAALLIMRSEVWILSFYSEGNYIDKVQVANYWAAFNFTIIVSMLSSTLANIVLPFIKKSLEDGFETLNKIVFKVSIIMVILLIMSSIFSYLLTQYYFDENYSMLPYYVFLLGFGVFASFFANIERLKLMVNTNLNRNIDRMVILQLIISIILNFLLIYFFGIWGAITTFVLVRFMGLLIFKYYGRSHELVSY